MLNLHFRRWLTLHSWALWGTIESTTLHDLSHKVLDLSEKFELRTLKTMRMRAELTFFEWLTLYFQALWGTVDFLTTSRSVLAGSITYIRSFSSVSWKLRKCMLNLRFLGWLTLHSWAPWGTIESSIPLPTCPTKSSICLRSLNFVPWKLCDCIETETDRQTETDNPLYRYSYRHPCVATEPIMFCYGLFIFFIYFFLFTVRSQKLLDRFSPNFQELCILV